MERNDASFQDVAIASEHRVGKRSRLELINGAQTTVSAPPRDRRNPWQNANEFGVAEWNLLNQTVLRAAVLIALFVWSLLGFAF